MVPVIVGPTAAGKSALAMGLATGCLERAEIVSADSRQVYVGMDIGTAKPSAEERAAVRHHLIDIITPDQLYSAGQFALAARAVIRERIAAGARSVVVGGSGFYIKALFEGLAAPEVDVATMSALEERVEREGYDALVAELAHVDPDAAAAHSANNRVKTLRALACWYQTGVQYSRFEGSGELGAFEHRPLYIGVAPERATLYAWINARAASMLERGLVEETGRLLSTGIAPDAPGLRTVGYKEAIEHLAGRIDRATMLDAIAQSTRRYAKRQMTWFRRVDGVRWLDPTREGADDAWRHLGGAGVV